MRAEEVIWLYRSGERNFRGQKLAGQSFVGQDLSGADFSKADIRGTNFTNACLNGALFTGAQAGVTRWWAGVILVTAVLLCMLLGMALSQVNTIAAIEIKEFAEFGFEAAIVRWVVITVLAAFLLIARYWDAEAGFSTFTIAFISAIAVTGLTSDAKPISGIVAIAIMVAYLSVILAALVGVLVALVAYMLTEALAAVLIGIFAFSALLVDPQPPVDLLMTALAVSLALLSAYSCWRTLRRGGGNNFISSIIGTTVTFVAARTGTSFRGADLTNADFSGAKLNGTDFSRSIARSAQRSMIVS